MAGEFGHLQGFFQRMFKFAGQDLAEWVTGTSTKIPASAIDAAAGAATPTDPNAPWDVAAGLTDEVGQRAIFNNEIYTQVAAGVTTQANWQLTTADVASDVTVAATPTNYTPGDTTVEGHLSGIDTELAGMGGDLQDAYDADPSGGISVNNTDGGVAMFTTTDIKATAGPSVITGAILGSGDATTVIEGIAADGAPDDVIRGETTGSSVAAVVVGRFKNAATTVAGAVTGALVSIENVATATLAAGLTALLDISNANAGADKPLIKLSNSGDAPDIIFTNKGSIPGNQVEGSAGYADDRLYVHDGTSARALAYEDELGGGVTEVMMFAVGDEVTDLTTGTAKLTFRMPKAFTLTEVRASVNDAPTGSTIIVDINESGTTILSTKLSIDISEKTSTTAAVPPVISDSSLADDAEMTIDIDQIGSTIAGTGLKVYLIGNET